MKYQPLILSFKELSKNEIKKRSSEFYKLISNRRSIRNFKKKNIDDDVIKNAILAAGSAPSGANLQPWFFVVIKNKDIKKKIRIAAEKEELNFYRYKAPENWLKALEPLGTNTNKKFIEQINTFILLPSPQNLI